MVFAAWLGFAATLISNIAGAKCPSLTPAEREDIAGSYLLCAFAYVEKVAGNPPGKIPGSKQDWRNARDKCAPEERQKLMVTRGCSKDQAEEMLASAWADFKREFDKRWDEVSEEVLREMPSPEEP